MFSSEITEQTQVTWQQRVLVWEQQRPCEGHEQDFYSIWLLCVSLSFPDVNFVLYP